MSPTTKKTKIPHFPPWTHNNDSSNKMETILTTIRDEIPIDTTDWISTKDIGVRFRLRASQIYAIVRRFNIRRKDKSAQGRLVYVDAGEFQKIAHLIKTTRYRGKSY